MVDLSLLVLIMRPLPNFYNAIHSISWMLCRVVSCRVVSCRVVSCRVVSCRVVSCRVCLPVHLQILSRRVATERNSIIFIIGNPHTKTECRD
jgi:hypothetical protein